MVEKGSILRHRKVVFEGMSTADGSLVYIDGNRLVSRVIVTDGAHLIQRSFWADDCLVPYLPFNCFTETKGGGAKIELQHGVFSDATCTRWKDSSGIATMVSTARLATFLRAKVREVNEREVYFEDTGWVPYVPPTAHWRFFNVSLTCTGNITHDLPPIDQIRVISKGISLPDKALGGFIILLVLGFIWRLYSSISFRPPREFYIARRKGLELGAELGSGKYGKVYKARYRGSKKDVAVKVLTLRPTEWRQVRSAWRECRIMSNVRHTSCIGIVDHYSVQLMPGKEKSAKAGNIGQSRESVHSTGVHPGSNDLHRDESDLKYHSKQFSFIDVTDALNEFVSISRTPSNTHLHPQGELDFQYRLRSSSSTKKTPYTPSTPANDEVFPQSISLGQSAPLLQIHIIMEYADSGTLNNYTRSGKLKSSSSSDPNLRSLLSIAQDVAEGLTVLHDPTRNMVHLDLSPNNVLLRTDGGRSTGVRAVLSDFGLSTVVALGCTHKTSETKGTVTFMPPELIGENIVSTSVDIYAMGMLILFMMKGEDPYDEFPVGRIISHKMSSGDNQALIPAFLALSDDAVVQQLLALVRWCTRANRKQRPTAQQVFSELERLSVAVEER